MSALPAIPSSTELLKLDLGAGTRPKDGFVAVDSRAFDGVHIVCDLAEHKPLRGVPDELQFMKRHAPYKPENYVAWPWDHNSVDEVHCSHMLEHLTKPERVHFANELHRVLKPGGKATIITPHAFSVRAYGDLTHEWPVVSFWYLYLNAAWRKENAPHNDGYTCDFDHGYGFGLHPTVQARNQEYQNYAVVHLLEGAQDLYVTLTKR